MTDRKLEHRPLMGGIQIVSARPADPSPQAVGSGTLTGLATRNNQKVLVTCLHVMAGVTEIAGVLQFGRNLRDDEEMYQVAYNHRDQRVGDTVEGRALQPTPIPNRVDGAYCVPHDLDREDLSFYLHGNGAHESKLLIADTVTPEVGMQVKILGSRNGEYDVTISSIGDVRLIGGRIFSGVVIADRPSRLTNFFGDSGAPVVKETAPGSGLFNMIGVLIGGNVPPFTNVLGEELFILPAHEYESAFGITFGKRPTTMHVFASPAHANVGDTVFLNGSGSLDPDGGELTFLWEQIEGQDVENFLTTDTSIASFTVPEGGYGSLRFRLTATDEYSLESAREVIVNRNPVAKIAEVADAGYLEEVTLDGSNSIDYARSTEQDITQLSYLWQQVFDSDPEEAQTPKVTLTGANTASASFTTPAENHRLKFKLTVTDRNNLSHSAEVIINVENKPPVADAGEDAYVEVSTAAPLDGSGSSDEDDQLDELSFNWQAPAESIVTILNPDHVETSFLAPSTAGDIEFTLTVTDPHETSATATVTKMVRVFTWSEWQDVDPLETRVSLLNPDEFEKKQFRTSDYGTTQHQWVPYSAPPPNGGQQDPPSGEDTSNGDTSGDTSGGDTSSGDTSGDTSGDDTSGDDTSGDDTSGDDTSDGDTSDGDTSDGDTSNDMSGGQQDPPPASPSADAGSNQSVDYGERVDLNGIGSTPVGKLSFSWSESSSHGIILESADTAYPYFTAPETYAVITVQLTVTHTESSETSTDSVTITVGSPPPPPPAPTADAGSDQSVGGNVTVTLDGSGSSGGTGALSYSWAETTSHNISLTGADTASPSFISPGSAAIVTVQLTVTDSAGLTSTDSVTITVTAPPPPPPPGEWSDWASTGVYKNENGRRWRQEMRHDIDDLSITEERWVDIGALSWGEWTFVRYEGSGASRMRVEQRTTTYSSHNTTETREVPDPEEIWPSTWTPVEPASYQGIGEDRERLYERTSNLGNRQTRWEPDPEEIWPSTWTPVEPASYQGDLAGRKRLYERTSNLGNRQTEWRSDPEPEIWPDTWTATDTTQGDLADRERLYERFSNYGNRQTVWRSDPEPEVWGPFVRRSATRGSLADRERLYISTSNYGNTRDEWRPDPEPEPEVYGAYVRTGTTRGSLADRKRLYRSTSNYGNTRDDWRSDPEPVTWGSWTATNTTQGELADRERLYERFSNYGNRQTQWRSDPETEVWGPFVRRSSTRGSLANRERLYISTSNYGNTRDEWRSDPEPIEWGDWTDTGNHRGSLANREKEQRRTSNYSTTETRWVSDPEGIEWGDWEDTGNHRGSLGGREKEQSRTSNYNTTETQWVSDPEPETWGSWTDTGNTDGSGAGREKEQSRTSNYGNTQTQWVADPEGVSWGAWRNTGTYRGSLGSREQRQKRTSNYGDVEYRWVDDPEPETWGSWSDTGETRENPDTFITEYEQSRTSNYGNVEYRWSE